MILNIENNTDSGVEEEDQPDQHQPHAQRSRRQLVPNQNNADSERANVCDSAIDLRFQLAGASQSDLADRFFTSRVRVKRNWFTQYSHEFSVCLLFIPVVLCVCIFEHPKWFTLLMFELPSFPFLNVAFYGTVTFVVIIMLSIVRCALPECQSDRKKHMFPGFLLLVYAVPFSILCFRSVQMLRAILRNTCNYSDSDGNTLNMSTMFTTTNFALEFLPSDSAGHLHLTPEPESQLNRSSAADSHTASTSASALEHKCCASILFAITALLELLLETASTVYLLLEARVTFCAHWRSRPRLSAFTARVPPNTRCYILKFFSRALSIAGWALCLVLWPFAVRGYYAEEYSR